MFLDPQPSARYTLLESLETLWQEPITLQIQGNFYKSKTLVTLLDEIYPAFLNGAKFLYINDAELQKIFANTNDLSW